MNKFPHIFNWFNRTGAVSMEANLSHLATSKQTKEVKHSIDNLQAWILGATLVQIVILMATIIGAAIVIDLKLSGL